MPVFNYAENFAAFAVGRRVNMEEWNTITRMFETNANLGFGVPVQRGATAKGIVAFTSGEFLGVTAANLVGHNVGDVYVQYDSVPVCEVGVIGVTVSESVTAGAAAGWSGTAWVVADSAAPQVPGCEFDSSGAANSVVALRVRRPVPA